MAGGDIVTALNSSKKGDDEDRAPEYVDDMFKPYNLVA